MNALAKAIKRSHESTSELSYVRDTREIRFASRHKARKAGSWAVKKYSGVFKKLAAV
jgi:hypothetical protein